MRSINKLYNKHDNKTCYIIGKGPSLMNLKKEHIGKGIVIAINQSILTIEKLNIPNIVYSIQKDGWPGADNNCPSLECDKCPYRIRPKSATLLVHELESIQCHTDYPNRYVFNNEEMGLCINGCSLLSSLNIGRLMGCNEFKLISFDATVKGDNRTYTPGRGLSDQLAYTESQSWTVLKYMIEHGYKWEYITPK